MTQQEHFDVFLSHSRSDARWVEALARRLEDEAHLYVWLDRWVLVPGEPWQRALVRGLNEAGCCAVCVGTQTPMGWFQMEVEHALNRQVMDASFRVVPVLLPGVDVKSVNNFLELRTWADFNAGDPDYAFHLLVSGIRGNAPGRWPR